MQISTATALEIIGIITFIVGVIFALWYNLFKEKTSNTKKEADEDADRLNEILKDTVDALEKKVDNLSTQLSIHSEEIKTLRNENDVMKKILQGRDDMTKAFQEEGFKSMARTKEINNTLKTLAELLTTHFKTKEEMK